MYGILLHDYITIYPSIVLLLMDFGLFILLNIESINILYMSLGTHVHIFLLDVNLEVA